MSRREMDTLRSEEQMERAVQGVLRSWVKRMAADPAHDIEDLAQELRQSAVLGKFDLG